uniref:Uncharacterized protein n=1 Tax=Knipowitschia caucasica TaxID=637954 RepID=A0AAV2K6C2_KNICA
MPPTAPQTERLRLLSSASERPREGRATAATYRIHTEDQDKVVANLMDALDTRPTPAFPPALTRIPPALTPLPPPSTAASPRPRPPTRLPPPSHPPLPPPPAPRPASPRSPASPPSPASPRPQHASTPPPARETLT